MNSIPTVRFSFSFRTRKQYKSYFSLLCVFVFLSFDLLVKMSDFRQIETYTNIFALSGLNLARMFYFVFLGFFIILLYISYTDKFFFKILCHFMQYLKFEVRHPRCLEPELLNGKSTVKTQLYLLAMSGWITWQFTNTCFSLYRDRNM